MHSSEKLCLSELGLTEMPTQEDTDCQSSGSWHAWPETKFIQCKKYGKKRTIMTLILIVIYLHANGPVAAGCNVYFA